MAKLTGKNLFVSFGGTTLSSSQRSFDTTFEQEQADVTAGADDFRNFSNTVKMVEAETEIVVQEHASGGSALFAALTLGGQGTLLWGPEGTATGKPKFGFYATLTERSQQLAYDDAYILTCKFTMAGTAMLFQGVTDLW
jgi:hypothetical protein